MKNPVALLILLLVSGLGHGQDAATTYPGGPALKRAPDFASWTITCQAAPANGAAPASGEPGLLPFATMTVIKTKEIRSVESTDMKGDKTSRWFYGGIESYTPPGTSFPCYLSAPDRRMPGAYINFAQTDFPDCDWVKPEMYAGTEAIASRKCFIFATTRKLTTPELMALAVKQAAAKGIKINPNDYDVNCRADIDIETRLPVKNQVGNLTYTYQFLPPPTAMLTLPPLMQARLDFEKKRNNDLTKHPAAD